MGYEDDSEFHHKPQSEHPERSEDTNGESNKPRPPTRSQVSFKLPTGDSAESDESHNDLFHSARFPTPLPGLDISQHSERSLGSHSSNLRKSHHRRNFRAVERKGSRGSAGGRCHHLGAYIRERAACLFATKSNLEKQDDQYYIPPPEDEGESIFDAFHQLYSGAFDDLSMWLYGASFWMILLFYWMLYMMFVVIFVALLYFVDRINLNDPTKSGGGCINTLREDGVLPLHAQLEFAFELSWTTFTTVGYGVSVYRHDALKFGACSVD